MTPEYQQRFGGIGRLYGQQALTQFAAAHVCVVGIGGVGSWAAEALARSGIGQLTLIDLDDICITNSNRQIHALQQTVGELKVEMGLPSFADFHTLCKLLEAAGRVGAAQARANIGEAVRRALEAV